MSLRELWRRFVASWRAAQLPDDELRDYLQRVRHRERVAAAIRRAYSDAMRDPEAPPLRRRRDRSNEEQDVQRRLGIRF